MWWKKPQDVLVIRTKSTDSDTPLRVRSTCVSAWFVAQIEALSLESLKASADEYREHFSRALGRAIQGTIKVKDNRTEPNRTEPVTNQTYQRGETGADVKCAFVGVATFTCAPITKCRLRKNVVCVSVHRSLYLLGT